MLGVIRKRNHSLDAMPHGSIMVSLFEASAVILTLIAFLVILGHFSPAR